jgi:NADH:flavin oxidoreductase / NADH oxidase family
MTAMTSNYAEDHILSERHIAFYRERAKGGAGLMITEQQGAYPYTKGSFHMGCSAWDKRSIPQYAKLADAVHEHGARMFAQLAGWGVHDKGAMVMDEWHPLWAASRVPSILHHETPMVVGQAEIDQMVEGFGQSAVHVQIAGPRRRRASRSAQLRARPISEPSLQQAHRPLRWFGTQALPAHPGHHRRDQAPDRSRHYGRVAALVG